jgi:hypothetical protein
LLETTFALQCKIPTTQFWVILGLIISTLAQVVSSPCVEQEIQLSIESERWNSGDERRKMG